jgi:hypothetical protein
MAVQTSELVVRLTDDVSGPARGIASALRGIGTAAKSVTIGAVVSQVSQGVRQLRTAVGSVGGALTTGIGGLGLYKLHHDVYEFAKATNRLSAANPDIAAAQIARIKDLARDITRTSLFDPATVMNAANSLARADVTIEAIEGALKPLANAAMAADVPVSQLADDFVKLASGFGLAYRTKDQARDTFGYLADLAQYVSQKAPGTFNDFVQAMKYVGPSVRALGVDIKWLAGAYIMLDKAGIRNAEAGTALRSMFKHIVQPTLSARGMYAQLGIDMAEFTKRSDKITSGQLVKRIAVEFGKDFSAIGPELQRLLDSGNGAADMQSALIQAITRAWGGKVKAQDARKLAKFVNNFLSSSVSEIDPEKWIKALAEKGVTFGQFLQVVEPRQAMRLRNLMNETLGEDAAAKALETPIGQMEGFRRGLADEAALKMMQGYPAAIAKLSAAWHSFIETLDKSGAIDRLADGLKALGESLANVLKGDASLKDWGISLAGLAPFIGPIALAVIGLAKAFGMLAATVKLAGAALLLFPLATLKTLLATGGVAAGAAGSGAAGTAAGAGAGVGALGAGLTVAGVLAAIYGLHKVTEPRAGTTLGERLRENRGNRSMRETLRDEFMAERKRLDIPAPDLTPQGEQTGRTFRDGIAEELDKTEKLIQDYIRRFEGLLGFTATPKISPMFAPAPAAPSVSPTRAAARGLYSDYDMAGDIA